MTYIHPFWMSREARNYFTPNDRYPEGKMEMFDLLRATCVGKVVEFGCGNGRLAEAFNQDSYYGYDPNPDHVEAAKLNFPNHAFGTEYPVPGGNVVLAWNVFLHVPDEHLAEVIMSAAAGARLMVIGEVMGRRWRRTTGPAPAFNRDASEYSAFGTLRSTHTLYVKRYNDFLTVLSMETKC